MLASLGTALAAESHGTMTAAIYPDVSRSECGLEKPRPPKGKCQLKARQVISVHDTIYFVCKNRATLVQREPVNSYLGQQINISDKQPKDLDKRDAYLASRNLVDPARGDRYWSSIKPCEQKEIRFFAYCSVTRG